MTRQQGNNKVTVSISRLLGREIYFTPFIKHVYVWTQNRTRTLSQSCTHASTHVQRASNCVGSWTTHWCQTRGGRMLDGLIMHTQFHICLCVYCLCVWGGRGLGWGVGGLALFSPMVIVHSIVHQFARVRCGQIKGVISFPSVGKS